MRGMGGMAIVAAVVLVLAANAVALVGVAYNRDGEPESRLTLSERELRLPRQWTGRKEDSGLALRIAWRIAPRTTTGVKEGWPIETRYGPAPWLDKPKMAALGFDVALPDPAPDERSAYLRQLPRDVFLVLELDGPAYRQALEHAQRHAAEKAGGKQEADAQKEVERELHESSRLFVVDAGLEVAALRARHPDRSAYAIVRGQVRPAFHRDASYSGMVADLAVDEITVPRERRNAFEGAKRYSAQVAFGRRLEPWLP